MLHDEPNSFIGRVIADRYTVFSLLGEGGFAWVFRAKNVFQKNVAIKVLHSVEASALNRFKREIEVLKALPSNVHIPRYFDDGLIDNEQPFLVLEYIEGRSLIEEIRQQEGFETREAVKIVFELCKALSGLHQYGVAHRDLKPENVMLTNAGGIKLIDFGLVRDAQGILRLLEQESPLVRSPVFATEIDRWKVAGTPEYMAPEQFSDAFAKKGSTPRTDTWSDVFSLGVILFEILSGHVPFPIEPGITRANFSARLAKYIKDRLAISDADIPQIANMDPNLESIVHKALRSDPRQRQSTAQMLGRDLGFFLRTGRGVSRRYGTHTVNMKLEEKQLSPELTNTIKTTVGDLGLDRMPIWGDDIATDVVEIERADSEVRTPRNLRWSLEIARPIYMLSDADPHAKPGQPFINDEPQTDEYLIESDDIDLKKTRDTITLKTANRIDDDELASFSEEVTPTIQVVPEDLES